MANEVFSAKIAAFYKIFSKHYQSHENTSIKK